MAPYRLLHGRDAKTSFDWNTPKAHTPKEKLNRDEAGALVRQLQEAHTVAKDHMAKAQERMRTAANRSRREVNFDKGDKVWLIRAYHKLSLYSRRPLVNYFFPCLKPKYTSTSYLCKHFFLCTFARPVTHGKSQPVAPVAGTCTLTGTDRRVKLCDFEEFCKVRWFRHKSREIVDTLLLSGGY